SIGKGFFSSFNLRDGLSVMINDCSFNDNMVMRRHASSNQQYFILMFNEPLNQSLEDSNFTETHVYDVRNNTILLTSSLMETTFIMPPKVRIRSVRIIFGNDFLNNFIGNEMADKFISNYFSALLK